MREIWKHEALDFTRRLEENLDVLNDVIDIILSEGEREQSTGTFSGDQYGNVAIQYIVGQR